MTFKALQENILINLLVTKVERDGGNGKTRSWLKRKTEGSQVASSKKQESLLWLTRENI
jgi:hypothetical protein